MRKKDLNKLLKDLEKQTGDYDKAVPKYEKALKLKGAELVSCDHRGKGEAIEQLLGIMREHGFTVLDDPVYEGSDTYGWVIFPPAEQGYDKQCD
jgi:hypothetical protein